MKIICKLLLTMASSLHAFFVGNPALPYGMNSYPKCIALKSPVLGRVWMYYER